MITRLELYKRIWNEPMVNIAKEFGVSSSYLARVCRRLNVPRPARGYWARVAAGQRPNQTTLQDAQSGDEISWNSGGGVAEIQGRTDPAIGTARTKRTTRKAHAGGQHDLVANAKPIFLAGNFTREGNYLVPSKRNLLDLVVTTATLDNALTLANALFLAFARKGHRVILAAQNEHISRAEVDTRDIPTKQSLHNNLWSPGRKTVLYTNGTPIGLTIFEITDATAMRYNGNGKYIKETDFVAPKGNHANHLHWKTVQDIPSGRLCIQAYASYYDTKWSRQWKERRPGDFLKKVTALAKEVIACETDAVRAINIGKQLAEAEQVRWEAMKEKWREDELEHKQAKAKQESQAELESLLARSERWERFDRLIATLTEQSADASDARKARLAMLIEAIEAIEGSRPTLDDFLAWKAPHERT